MTFAGTRAPRRSTPPSFSLAWPLAVTVLVIAAACGGDSEPGSAVRIDLATDAAVQSTVSSAGGTIEVADATRDVEYRLTVPAGALSSDGHHRHPDLGDCEPPV